MTGDIEAAGDAITGGLLARAVEPHAGAAGESHAAGICLNCGTALKGPFCHACGQPEHIHRSLGAIWHDLAHGVFHFEGKIWRTLPMLAWRPGDLTRRYIHGERARFISPLALFLFSIFLMFAVINAFGGHIDDIELKGPDAASGKSLTFQHLNTGWAALDQGLDKGFAKASANPGLALYKIQSNAYKYSWALIPISVPFVWLLFAWHRRRHLYDHTVFVTYSLAAMSLFGVLLTLLGVAGVPATPIALAAVFLPPLHLYRQLKRAYEIGRWSAIARTLILLIFALVAMTLFLTLLLSLGLLG